MFLSFRWSYFLIISAALSALGCDDGTYSDAEEGSAVRTKTQLALVGEACSDDADCDDPCHTGVTCDTAGTGLCVGTPVTDGTACDTNSDLCDGQVCGGGICGSGTPVDCPDGDPNDCTFPTCAPSTGTCTNVENEPEDTLCSDGNACTIGDACNAAGSCSKFTNTITCTDSNTNDCVIPTCNTSTGACSDSTNEPDNTPCDTNSNLCDGQTCGGGVCGSGTPAPVICTDPDANDCVFPACEPSTGACSVITNQPEDSPCNDNNACTSGDACDDAGACTKTTSTVTCVDPDLNDCVFPTCNSSTGLCDVLANQPQNTACSDGNACTLNDSCNASGSCSQSTGSVNCPDPSPTDCTYPTCNTSTGACDVVLEHAEDTLCSDGNACTLGDACDSSGSCTKTTGNVNCVDPNLNDCVFPTCNPTNGQCTVIVNQPEDTVCNDGNACTLGDACNNAGVCNKSTGPLDCSDPNPSDCVGRTCNPAVGCQNINLTTNNPNPTTSYCDDNVACTEFEYCQAGVCRGRPNDNNCPNGACFIGICDSSLDCQPRYDSLAGTVCRPEASGTNCDVAETCPVPGDPNYGTPAGQSCPPDAFAQTDVSCSDASCGSGLQIDEAFCSGVSAVCPDATEVTCPGFACTTDPVPVCRFDCTSSTHCLTSHYCDTTSGQCVPRINPGQPCTSNGQCGQGDFCVDGVCCNSTCSGQCEACDEPGFEGECVTISGAPHPGQSPDVSRPACNTDGTSCAGTCGGTSPTACTYPSSSTVCSPAACDPTANQAVEASMCNGAGACVAPTPSSCAPFVCDGSVCRGDCSQDSHCTGNQQCNGGVCVNPFSNGQDCTVGSQCQSGNCVDGVCCESACAGQCEACNVAGSRGTCVAATGAPVGSRPSCAGSGTCRGSCDGATRSACTFPSTDVSCRSASCTTSTATLGAYCNGAGSCPAAQTVACSEGCSGAICADGECLLNSECPTGEVCRASVCVPADPLGTACALNSDCESGFCVDGVCCDGACSGQCEACDVAGNVGTCSAVSAGERPHGSRPPCATDGSECGGACDGSDRTACDYPTGTSCRDGSCSDGVATVAALCNGTGLCPTLQEQDCGMVACDSSDSVCDGPCATDPNACGSGEYCSAGICVDLIENGETCATDGQCESGFCVDGYCCNSGCDGQCAACDVPGSEGLCSPVTGAARGPRPACMGGGTCGAQCNGEDTTQCSYPQADVACGAPTCQSGVETAQAFCDGTGICSPGEATACPSLVCNGSQCADACETDEDCLGDLICENNACVVDPLINAVDKGSCGCRIPGDSPRGGGSPWLLLLPVGFMLARRRSAHLAAKGASLR